MLSGFLLPFLILLLLLLCITAHGFGSMGPISAAFGESGIFCAIDASGKQNVICWGNTGNSSASYSVDVPPMAALSGGDGFLCGISSNTSQAFCWDPITSGTDLVPSVFKSTAYSHIAAGANHVCAIRGSYYSDSDWGTVDCWEIVRKVNHKLTSVETSLFSDQSVVNHVFSKVVSGDGFSCGSIREGGVVCWGPDSGNLGLSQITENFVTLATGKGSLCGVLGDSGEAKCWGDMGSIEGSSSGTRFVSLTVGLQHFCGIREDNHGIECWGSFNLSSIPKGSGFMAIASSDVTTCGIKEDDLVLDCWFVNTTLFPDYDPPPLLCSPGLCLPGSCGENEFAFNASILNEQDLTSLCVRRELSICSPCGLNCSQGFFTSSSCTQNADRVCTACSLCQNSSCLDVCGLPSLPPSESHPEPQRRFQHLLVLIVGCCVLGLLLLLAAWCLFPYVIPTRNEEGTKKQFGSCMGKQELESEISSDPNPLLSITPYIETAQVFRLSELKDATTGFKEFNELGRGSYGFVYKAILSDGRHVAVKRANAATIIHTNSRDFEMELEILCKIRHSNIVNLLGYCSEMGERLLVYEFMPHGTLHDHLHGGLSPLNWNTRLKIAMQASKGLEYLHTKVPPIVHRDIKSSNILLDSDWVARISDFGLLGHNERDANGDIKGDVYNFGIVLLEILSGRKAHDLDYAPPGIVEWALPLIREGKAAAIVDDYIALPRNFEPLLKLADLAERALRENSSERPDMADVATCLEQIMKDGLVS